MHRNSKVDLGLEEMEANHGPNCPNFRVENPCRTSQCRNGRRKTRRHSQQTLRRIGRAVPAETIDLPGRNLRGDQGVTSYRKALLISSPYRFKATLYTAISAASPLASCLLAVRLYWFLPSSFRAFASSASNGTISAATAARCDGRTAAYCQKAGSNQTAARPAPLEFLFQLADEL